MLQYFIIKIHNLKPTWGQNNIKMAKNCYFLQKKHVFSFFRGVSCDLILIKYIKK
jgi:hypothetical protein